MRRLKIMGVALVAVLAISAVSASGASAGEKLVLKEGGQTAPAGAKAVLFYTLFWRNKEGELSECFRETSGELLGNDKAKDKLVSSSSVLEEDCFGEALSQSTTFPTLQLTGSGTGTIKFKPKLAITTPGPCVYEFAKMTAKLDESEPLAFFRDESTLGKRNKKASIASCATTLSVVMTIPVFYSERNYFETEFKP